MTISPCFMLCTDCKNSIKDVKRIKCSQGYFDVILYDALLLVPFDFECVLFERREDDKQE